VLQEEQRAALVAVEERQQLLVAASTTAETASIPCDGGSTTMSLSCSASSFALARITSTISSSRPGAISLTYSPMPLSSSCGMTRPMSQRPSTARSLSLTATGGI